MTSTEWRPATVTDLPMIFRAERDYIDAVEPSAREDWTAAIDRNLALWIANLPRTTVLESDGQPAGFAMWMPEDDGAAALLITIQVLRAFRRQGLGRRLLERFAEEAGAAGLSLLRLGVHERNPAIHLYDRAGYRVTGRDGAYVLYERAV